MVQETCLKSKYRQQKENGGGNGSARAGGRAGLGIEIQIWAGGGGGIARFCIGIQIWAGGGGRQAKYCTAALNKICKMVEIIAYSFAKSRESEIQFRARLSTVCCQSLDFENSTVRLLWALHYQNIKKYRE